jgi:hypothetical protein
MLGMHKRQGDQSYPDKSNLGELMLIDETIRGGKWRVGAITKNGAVFLQLERHFFLQWYSRRNRLWNSQGLQRLRLLVNKRGA